MHSSDLDVFFHLASQGDKDAYGMLYQKFIERANSVIFTTLRGSSNYKSITEDFCVLIDELFFKAINEYAEEKGLFSSFADWILARRLVPQVKKYINDMQTYVTNIDYEDEDIDCIELLADKDHNSMASDIAMNDFKLKIASRNKHRSREERLKDRILLLQYAGYPNTEICKLLNLTYSTLRRLSRDIKTDEDIANIKLDLK